DGAQLSDIRSAELLGRKAKCGATCSTSFCGSTKSFLDSYHKRSNVESRFSNDEAKIGDSLRSKTDTAMVNEALCKILCHNLVVLIHEIHELGINPVFGLK